MDMVQIIPPERIVKKFDLAVWYIFLCCVYTSHIHFIFWDSSYRFNPISFLFITLSQFYQTWSSWFYLFLGFHPCASLSSQLVINIFLHVLPLFLGFKTINLLFNTYTESEVHCSSLSMSHISHCIRTTVII
jgi:hypothetical protein